IHGRDYASDEPRCRHRRWHRQRRVLDTGDRSVLPIRGGVRLGARENRISPPLGAVHENRRPVPPGSAASRSPRRRVACFGESHGGHLMAKAPLSRDELAAIDAYWRAANYLTVGQIYLQENALLREPLRPEHIKPRLLGHW